MIRASDMKTNPLSFSLSIFFFPGFEIGLQSNCCALLWFALHRVPSQHLICKAGTQRQARTGKGRIRAGAFFLSPLFLS